MVAILYGANIAETKRAMMLRRWKYFREEGSKLRRYWDLVSASSWREMYLVQNRTTENVKCYLEHQKLIFGQKKLNFLIDLDVDVIDVM